MQSCLVTSLPSGWLPLASHRRVCKAVQGAPCWVSCTHMSKELPMNCPPTNALFCSSHGWCCILSSDVSVHSFLCCGTVLLQALASLCSCFTRSGAVGPLGWSAYLVALGGLLSSWVGLLNSLGPHHSPYVSCAKVNYSLRCSACLILPSHSASKSPTPFQQCEACTEALSRCLCS